MPYKQHSLRGKRLLAAAAAACLMAARSADAFMLDCKDAADLYNSSLVPSTSMRTKCKIPPYSEYLQSQNKTEELATLRKQRASPSFNWGFWLEGYWEVPETAGWSGSFHVYPDSHMPAVPNPDGGWVVFWSNAENLRSIGPTPYFEHQQKYEPWGRIFGGRTGYKDFSSGGKWLMSVSPHPTDKNPKHLVAFYHAEDGYWPYQGSGGPAWKSIGVAHSWDLGITWHDYGQVVTSNNQRPPDWQPYYGGVGNFDAMWDAENKRWIMYFNEHWMGLAISTDPNGMPGSWSKWNGWTYGYNQPGLGGSFVPLPGLADVPGANPSISWNTYLSKFVMVYSGWDYKLHISASHDGIQWDQVRTLTGSVDWTRAWYPTLMSDNGPYISFKDVAIYYADRFHGWDQRKIVKKTLHFQRYD